MRDARMPTLTVVDRCRAVNAIITGGIAASAVSEHTESDRSIQSMDDRTLMELRADVLYRYDSRGRMIESNEPEPKPSPRLFLGRTLAGDVVRFGRTVPDA